MGNFRPWKSSDRVMLKDVLPLDTPYNIVIEVSSLCNASCTYCAHSLHFPTVYEGNMSEEIYSKILQDVKSFPQRIKLFDMFGFGEPLCNPNLPNMIKQAKKEGVVEKIGTTTNGLLLTKSRVDELISSGIDVIRISLQGIDAEQYRNICGVNIDFDRFISNLEYLYKNKENCEVRMKIADISLSEIPDGEKRFMDIFAPIADSVFIENIIPIYVDIDYDRIDTKIKENAFFGREDVKQDRMNVVCHRPFYRLRVAANGDVCASCCDMVHDPKYGNIKKNSLVEIWNNNKRKQFLKMQLKGERFSHPVCRDCILANDIASEKDILDPYAEELLKRF